jgi:ABC-type uncharacterized transport system ATPase subunit
VETVGQQEWVTAASVNGNILRVTVNDLKRARRELLALALAQEIPLRRFEEVRPSLEDVFLQLTGTEAAQ